MSRTAQIESVLLGLSEGLFQKLADAYLAERGYGRVNSIGSVAGADKTRTGTPDALVRTPGGRYIFAEHTTQQDRVATKLAADLEKCLDPRKTGIPMEEIDCVILCFTGSIDSAAERRLFEACSAKGVRLELVGLDVLSRDLSTKYSGLARDFLGVVVDTGQIVSPDRFVSMQNAGRIAARLDLDLHFRENELNQLLGLIEESSLVLLSGRAGVGKTRLALEVCRHFGRSNPEYEVACIFGRNRDLWEDLEVRFRRPGRFLLLVDDANRVSQFDYVVDLLRYQTPEQSVKVIATVRDYALGQVRGAAYPIGGVEEVHLAGLSDENIKELVTAEYGIQNYHYLERITSVARGNPRLAVMAAEVAKDKPLSSIHDVTDLYDEYFSSIRHDFLGGPDPGSSALLAVAAIVSFFKAVDRTNAAMMAGIANSFGFAADEFWATAQQLHEMEILDMYEDEVVRISDQVLGTYLFYLATFAEESLDFGALLSGFFPRLRHRLIDSINPVLAAFDQQRVLDVLDRHVTKEWSRNEAEGNHQELLELVDVFWFVKRTEALLWVKSLVEELEPHAAPLAAISFVESNQSLPSPSILSVLRGFSHAEEAEVRVAVELTAQYLKKRPEEAPATIRLLSQDFGFTPISGLQGFAVQHVVIDVLTALCERRDPLFVRLFLAVAGRYLQLRVESHSMKDGGVLQMTRFGLPHTEELESLRSKIWSQVFELFGTAAIDGEVLNLLREQGSHRPEKGDAKVVATDARQVLPFLKTELDRSEYSHCVLVRDYLDHLERYGVDYPAALRTEFTNETYELASILLPEWGERGSLDLSFEEYEDFKAERIGSATAGYVLEDYVRFFDRCEVIRGSVDDRQADYSLPAAVERVLVALSQRDRELYVVVLGAYLDLGDPLRLHPGAVVRCLRSQVGYEETVRILERGTYDGERRWLLSLHASLSEAEMVSRS